MVKTHYECKMGQLLGINLGSYSAIEIHIYIWHITDQLQNEREFNKVTKALL